MFIDFLKTYLPPSTGKFDISGKELRAIGLYRQNQRRNEGSGGDWSALLNTALRIHKTISGEVPLPFRDSGAQRDFSGKAPQRQRRADITNPFGYCRPDTRQSQKTKRCSHDRLFDIESQFHSLLKIISSLPNWIFLLPF